MIIYCCQLLAKIILILQIGYKGRGIIKMMQIFSVKGNKLYILYISCKSNTLNAMMIDKNTIRKKWNLWKIDWFEETKSGLEEFKKDFAARKKGMKNKLTEKITSVQENLKKKKKKKKKKNFIARGLEDQNWKRYWIGEKYFRR